MPLVFVSFAFLLGTSAIIWRDDLRRGGAPSLGDVRPIVVVGDLAAAMLWMAASAPNDRSFAFVIVLAVGALAMFRLGTLGVLLTGGAYFLGRIAQELIRVQLGTPTPVPVLVAEYVIVGLVLIILVSTVGHYRAEQIRGARALRLARSLERIAKEIGELVDPATLFKTIAGSALVLVDADHATINQRRGEEFWIVAGAGTGERAVGVHAPATRGIVGAVIRSRQTVAFDDYAADETAVPAIRDLGVRSIVGVPITVQGDIVA